MNLREAAQQALEALEMSRRFVYADNRPQCDEAIDALRAALSESIQTEKENTMPITDDHGKALLQQYRVIEQFGNWRLLYDQIQLCNVVRHEFRIQKLQHDIALYPGISLAEAQKRFRERVKAAENE